MWNGSLFIENLSQNWSSTVPPCYVPCLHQANSTSTTPCQATVAMRTRGRQVGLLAQLPLCPFTKCMLLLWAFGRVGARTSSLFNENLSQKWRSTCCGPCLQANSTSPTPGQATAAMRTRGRKVGLLAQLPCCLLPNVCGRCCCGLLGRWGRGTATCLMRT